MPGVQSHAPHLPACDGTTAHAWVCRVTPQERYSSRKAGKAASGAPSLKVRTRKRVCRTRCSWSSATPLQPSRRLKPQQSVQHRTVPARARRPKPLLLCVPPPGTPCVPRMPSPHTRVYIRVELGVARVVTLGSRLRLDAHALRSLHLILDIGGPTQGGVALGGGLVTDEL